MKLPFQFKFVPNRLRNSRKLRTRTFIMPTGFGYAFGTMAFVLLMLAMGYANNLMYFFVFGLISVALTSMHLTNRNVDRILVEIPEGSMIYANERGEFTVRLSNEGRQDSHLLSLQFRPGPYEPLTVGLDHLPAHASSLLRVPVVLSRRGLQAVPRLTLSSQFPFELLRAWRNVQAKHEIVVFPERRGQVAFPEGLGENPDQGLHGLFRDHRLFQSTDSPRRIDWRASAKVQGLPGNLLVKNYEAQEKRTLHFTWEQSASAGDFEHRLSQLSLWLSQAEEYGFNYSLQVRFWASELGQGESHLRRCLSRLGQLEPGDRG